MPQNAEEQAIIMASHTMGKDLLALVLQEIRTMPKVWIMLSEADQAAVMDRIKNRIKHIAETAVSILSDEGCVSVIADIEGVNFKEDGIKATLKINRGNPSENLGALTASCGQVCRIILTGAEKFTGGMDEIKPEKDQKELDLNPPAASDELMVDALELFVNLERVSISELQTDLRISYARAARIVDLLENDELISKPDANGNRTISTIEDIKKKGYSVTESSNGPILIKKELTDETEKENPPDDDGEDETGGDVDSLYPEAVKKVTESKKVSISLLQRLLDWDPLD